MRVDAQDAESILRFEAAVRHMVAALESLPIDLGNAHPAYQMRYMDLYRLAARLCVDLADLREILRHDRRKARFRVVGNERPVQTP